MADITSYQDLGYDRIFVSLDGSEEQGKVLDRAIVMAANDNAELYIGHVIDSTALEAAGTYPVDIIPTLEQTFRDSIAEKVAAAEAMPGIKKIEVFVRSGRIRETLKDEMLDVIHPDLVICGAPGALLDQVRHSRLPSPPSSPATPTVTRSSSSSRTARRAQTPLDRPRLVARTGPSRAETVYGGARR